MRSYLTHLECGLCYEKYDADVLSKTCPKDKRPLLARYDLSAAAADLRKDRMEGRVSSMWRYREVLPVKDVSYIVSLGEGWTPLLRPDGLRRKLGMTHLYVKDESGNPTSSFKARGLSCAVSRAAELGVRKFTAPSAGNAGGALAAYGAAGSYSTDVFMPKFTPSSNILECRAYGANVHLVDGFITDAGKLSAKFAEEHGCFDVSTLREPYRVEGKKTMGYEIVEQLGKVPDVIVYPTGGGTGVVGIWKALSEMEELGWIGSERPRMVSVQAEGCAPIVDAFILGKEFAEPILNPSTVANGLLVPAAVGDFLVLRALKESKGVALSVSDGEMLEGLKILASSAGIFAAPEGGATLAGLQKMLTSRIVSKDETVVLINTGSGLKYLDAVSSTLSPRT